MSQPSNDPMGQPMSPERLRRALRASVQEHVAGVHVAVLTREQVREQLRLVRRRRLRSGIVPVVAAVAAAVVIALVAGGGLGFGLHRLAPAPAVPGPDRGPSKLAAQPTQGSLAGDQGFLAGIRQAVVDLPEQDVGGNRLAVGSARDVKVLYAGDVATYRVVLVEALYRNRSQAGYHRIWFDAARGTSPAAMTSGNVDFSGTAPGEVAWHWLPHLGPSAASGTGAFIVLSATGGQPVLAHSPTYDADATVHWRIDRPSPAGPGWWQGTVAWDHLIGTAGLIQLPGDNAWLPLDAGSGQDQSLQADAGLPPVHGTATPTGDRQRYAFQAAQSISGLPTTASSRRLLWSGTLQGWWIDVIAVTAPSGAHIVTTVAQQPITGPGSMGTYTLSRVLAAGPLDQIAFAWTPLAPRSTPPTRAPRAGADPTSPPPTPTAQPVGLIGPVGAANADIADGGRFTTIPLTDGGAATTTPASRVTFTDAQHRVLTTIPIATTDDPKLTSPAP